MKNIHKKMGIALCFLLGICMVWKAMPILCAEEKNPHQPDNIVTVDIPYSLFVSLVAYQELTEMENTGKKISSEMIPVLENIVEYLRTEREKYKNLSSSDNISPEYRQFLLRLDSHLESFDKELLCRRSAAEYEALKEKQKTIIENSR